MAFLSNKTVNCLNLHLGLVGLLDQSYFVFSPVYLYGQGFSVAAVLTLYAALNMLRLPLRLLAFPVIHRFGLKAAVMIGAAGYGLSYPLLGCVHGVDGWLIGFMLIFSLGNAMHWLAFHALYSLAGEAEKRGRQVAVALALSTGLASLAPILSALFITGSSFQSYFCLAFLVAGLMLLNLSRCADIAVPENPPGASKTPVFNLGTKIHLMEASISYPMTLCWMFTVYLFVGKIVSLGGIVTFGVLVQIVYQLLLGSWVDKGRGATVASAAAGLRSMVAVGKAFIPLSLSSILGVEAAAAAANVHTNAISPTVIYNAGKEATHTLRFWLFTESAWDLGTLIGAGGSAFLLWQGVALRHVILIALPFIGILWWLVYGYCKRHPLVHPSL